MSSDKPAVVLLVDDDEGVQLFVGQILKRAKFEVAAAIDGEQAVNLAPEVRPELIILDLSLPGLGGLDVCARLRKWYTGPILVLSGDGDERTIVQALDLGADDYLTKPFRPAELMARLRALLRRAAPAEEEETEVEAAGIRVDLARRAVYREGKTVKLTRTEFDILSFLMRHMDRVVTSEMILKEVWGPHHGEYNQSLRVHIGHIRRKLQGDAVPANRLILTEPGVGYRFTSEPQAANSAAS